MSDFQPVYIKSAKTGILSKKKEEALNGLKNCRLCPRNCEVDRTAGETGFCKTGVNAVVASYSPHFGEEAPLVGTHGSGTIFFTHCNLQCNFCQNYDISHEGFGTEVSSSQLAMIMIELQNMGCHNINFVTPSHVIPQIISAVEIALEHGLKIPLVYNTGAYDHKDSLKLLEGIIDVYMPDFKFWDEGISQTTMKANDYPEIARIAIKEMHRQTGDLEIENGIAKRGLIIRHLVMPNQQKDTNKILEFIANEISIHTYLNIMPQYRPCGTSNNHPQLSRRITDTEYNSAIKVSKDLNLQRLD